MTTPLMQNAASTSPACAARSVPHFNEPNRYRRSDRRSCSQLHGTRTVTAHALAVPDALAFWRRSEGETAPPRPAPHFTRTDLRRIKAEGPTIEDCTYEKQLNYTTRDGVAHEKSFSFVPPDVLGDTFSAVPVEPEWRQLPEMSGMEFQHGLRSRNWTSVHFDAAAEPWHVEFWRDSGRFMWPSYPGYRATVTHADGSTSWVNLPVAGAPTDVADHLAGGTAGGIYRQKRVFQEADPFSAGYNQAFEQVFQAYEEKLPEKARLEFEKTASRELTRSKLKRYNCPADQVLTVGYQATPEQPSITGAVSDLGETLQYALSLSFVSLCCLFSIVRTQKKAPSDLQEALDFAQSKAKARKDGTTDVTLDDVAGLDGIKEQFQEIVAFLKDPDQYARTGVKAPKGILLEGPPGTGKTLIAKAIAGEAAVGFYQMSGSEFVEAIVGVGAARVRDLFKRARAYDSPCIIFVDEIDALGIKRAAAGIKTNEEREQTLNQLLTEMDGFNPSAGIVFVAATNRADLLDPALLRVGRFDRKIAIPRPDAQSRLAILEVHARKHAIAPGVDLTQLAYDLPGLVGADLSNVLNEAALAAVRGGDTAITEDHLTYAKDRVLQGVRKPMLSTGTALGERLMVSLAVHEGGRALLATDARARTGLVDPIEKVSILRRGWDFTRTTLQRRSDDDYLLVTKAQLEQKLRVQLAGHAAEEVMGLDISTYSARDFTLAQEIAVRMVENYGMSGLGVTTYAKPTTVSTAYQEGKAAITELFQKQALVEADAPGLFQPHAAMVTRLEDERRRLVTEAYDDVVARLTQLRPALERVSAELRDKMELDGHEVTAMYEAHVAESGAAPDGPAP